RRHRLDAVYDDPVLALFDNAAIRGLRLCLRPRTINGWIDDGRRHVEVFVDHLRPEAADIVGKALRRITDCIVFPGLRIVDVGEEYSVIHVRKATEHAAADHTG